MVWALEDRQMLRAVARRSIEVGLERRRAMTVALSDYPDRLRVERATFVSLHHEGELLGCIGTLRPHRPLVVDVVHNAYQAAFGDPRFAGLQAVHLARLEILISVLSPLDALAIRDEADLLAQLRPGRDGVVLEEGERTATFLPVMWPRLPTPRAFVRALKEKAGLPPDYWSATMRAFRYTTDEL